MLAWYLPSMPFILWTFEVVGWVVLVVEMVIAALLWAIAHGMTEGEGAVGQSAKQGYLLFLRAALQPAIMVVAFWLAMVVLVPVSRFVAK